MIILFLIGIVLAFTTQAVAAERPNFIIIYTDDQGYEDVGCFGSPDINTPNLDQMAQEGTRLTNFYVSAPICSASRAALLTGCYSRAPSCAATTSTTSITTVTAVPGSTWIPQAPTWSWRTTLSTMS